MAGCCCEYFSTLAVLPLSNEIEPRGNKGPYFHARSKSNVKRRLIVRVGGIFFVLVFCSTSASRRGAFSPGRLRRCGMELGHLPPNLSGSLSSLTLKSAQSRHTFFYIAEAGIGGGSVQEIGTHFCSFQNQNILYLVELF